MPERSGSGLPRKLTPAERRAANKAYTVITEAQIAQAVRKHFAAKRKRQEPE